MSEMEAGTEEDKNLRTCSAVIKERLLPQMNMRGMPASNILSRSLMMMVKMVVVVVT